MGTIQINTRIRVTDDNGHNKEYNFSDSATTSADANVQQTLISGTATAVIWDPATWTNFPTTSFSRLIIHSTASIDLELTVNEGDANEELNSVRVVADIPFMLGADDAYFNHGASDIYANGSGALDVIDKIRAKGVTAGTTATVTVIMAE